MIVLLLLPAVPLMVDVFSILMQRASPPYLNTVIDNKLKKLQVQYGESEHFTIKNSKLFTVDKGYNILNVYVEIENTNMESNVEN